MQAPDMNIVLQDEPITKAQSIEEGLIAIPREQLEETVNMNRSQRRRWMREQACMCGSGKKFKKCCQSKY